MFFDTNFILLAGTKKTGPCIDRHPSFCRGDCEWDHESVQCTIRSTRLDDNYNDYLNHDDYDSNDYDKNDNVIETVVLVQFSKNGNWRSDRRCGREFPLPDGSGPTQCNPNRYINQTFSSKIHH